MDIGPFSIDLLEEVRRITARTNSNTPSDGSATSFEARSRRGALVLADIYWDTGERDVRTLEVSRGGATFGRLLRGGRIGVYDANFQSYPEDIGYLDLSVMRFHPKRPKHLPTAVRADYETLCEAAGNISVWDELSFLGALGIAPRSHLFGDTSTRRNYLAVTFPVADHLVPVAAYVMTRLISLSRAGQRAPMTR